MTGNNEQYAETTYRRLLWAGVAVLMLAWIALAFVGKGWLAAGAVSFAAALAVYDYGRSVE